MKICNLCPRRCGVDREIFGGYCGVKSALSVALFSLHSYEEPVISGTRGSGTVFFNGCNLKCCFCQNGAISRCSINAPVTSEQEFVEKLYALKEAGAHNINLVTPTHYADILARILSKEKKNLNLPIVYNTGGYDSVQTLQTLEGIVDVYLPDSKFYSAEISKKYCGCADYFEQNLKALAEMQRQCPSVQIKDGIMRQGVLIRHLVLPSLYRDSIALISALKENLAYVYLSLMSQYTPQFNTGGKELDRKITSFEYGKVLDYVRDCGIEGFMQNRDSADTRFTPKFK